jgi:hypothetical protein
MVSITERDGGERVNTMVEEVKAAVDPNAPLKELRSRLTLKMKLIVNRGVSGVSRRHGSERRYERYSNSDDFLVSDVDKSKFKK